jgi:hypothetical protein
MPCSDHTAQEVRASRRQTIVRNWDEGVRRARVAVDTARSLPVRSPPVIAAITLEYRLADAATEAGVGHPHPVGAWPVARSLHRCV